MAKESERKELDYHHSSLDKKINYLYRTGVFHSIIWHSSLLLILCLSAATVIPKRISLEISFESDTPGVSLEEPVKIDFDEPASASGSDNSDLLEEIIAENNRTEFPTEEELVVASFPESISETPSDIISDISIEDLSTQFTQESQESIESTSNTNQNSTNEIVGELIKSIPSSGSNGINNGFGETGAALEIGRRLNAAGAKTGDVQVSIGWNTIDDIDVHVFFKSFSKNSYISWTNRIGVCGGMLDVDMNANRYYISDKPVENIFWPKGNSPYGEFVVSLHNFRNWSGAKSVPVVLIIKVDGETKILNTECIYGQPVKEVFRFTRIQN